MPEITKTTKQNTSPIYAGFFKRTAAFLVDCFLLYIIGYFLNIIIENLIHPADIYINGCFGFKIYRLNFIVAFLTLIYFLVFESKYQSTIGKKLFNLKIVNKDGNKIPLKSVWGRFLFVLIFVIFTQIPSIILLNGGNLVQFRISFPIIFLCIISYLCLLFSSKKQTLYDKLTKTFVIENKKSSIVLAWILLLGLIVPIFLFFLHSLVLIFFWDV